MDSVQKEVAERREADAERATEAKILEIRGNVPQRQEEALVHQETQHLKHLKFVADGCSKFMADVDRMKANEEQEFEAKKAQLLRDAETMIMESSNRNDSMTAAALKNINENTIKLDKEAAELDKEINDAKSKNTEMEIQVNRQVFDEVEARKDKNEVLFEQHNEELRKRDNDILETELNVLKEEREEKKQNANLIVAEIREDLQQQSSLGMCNLKIQQHSIDQKQRRQINEKINDVKNYLENLDDQFGRVIGVIGADKELYDTFTPQKKRKTKDLLRRFMETLRSISSKLCDIEQNLASLELRDVEMNESIQQIKTQISSFQPVFGYLTAILETQNAPMNPEKAENFSNLKEKLFEMINQMPPIPERRSDVMDAISNRTDVTMETLSIQMGQAHSSRLQSIQEPPSYDTTKNVKSAITEN